MSWNILEQCMAAPLVVVSEAVHGCALLASQPRWQHRIALHSLVAGSTASDTSLRYASGMNLAMEKVMNVH